MIFILDRQEEVIGLLKNGGANSQTPPFFDDLLTQDLKTGAETFQFSTILDDKGIASNLVVGNYVSLLKDGKYKLFQIMQTEEQHDETMYITVYCECAGLELINNIVRKNKLISCSLNRFMTTILSDTSWNVGKMPIHSESYDIELSDESVYSALQNNISTYGVEIEFRVEINNGKISKKYIDVYENRGTVTRKRFEFGKNVEGISRKTDLTNVYTALIGKGKDGISFKDTVVSGIDKPKGQDFVSNQVAYDRYNNNGYHIMGIYEYDTDSPEELLRKTYEQLNKCNEPHVEYEVNIAVLSNLLNEDISDISIGDTVYVIDNYFQPPIHLAARVNNLETSETDPTRDRCTLSNFIEIESNITDDIRKIAATLEGYIDSSVNSKFPVTSENIANGAITQDKIVEYSIETKHLKADSITAEKIKADEIEAKHIKANAITTDHLRANAITTDKLDANSITAEKIQANSINAGHIESNSINATHIVANTITADSSIIQDGAIVNAKIASAAIDTANIRDLAVGTAQIKDAAIDSAKIDKLAVNTVHIQDAAITNAKIDNLNAEKITAGDIQVDRLTASVIAAINASITEATIDSAKIGKLTADHIKAIEIETESMKANVINAINAYIGEAVIDGAKIGNLSADKITSGEIQTDILKSNIIEAINASIGKISADHIDVNSLVVGDLDASKITTGDLDADRIKTNVISAINSYIGEAKISQAQIETLTVGNANITDGTINGAKISKASITNAQIKDATIESAKIIDLDVSKLKSGTIDSGKINIGSQSGNLSIQDNTISIKDNEQRMRVQVGLDSRGQYGILVFNSQGQPIFDSDRGIISTDGLSDDIISTEKIKDNAIDSRTLNVDELFVDGNAFINRLKAVEIDAARITTGQISGERIDIDGLVSFESFNEDIQNMFLPTYKLDEETGEKIYDRTYINGGNLSTGSIKADKIDLLSGISVLGQDNMKTFSISETGEIEINGLLQSGNFDNDNKTGYKITPNGKAILNEATIRGTVELENAGMTNDNSITIESDSPTRIWAGSSFENRDKAPFRVLQNGDVYASNAKLSGTLYGDFDNGNIHIKENSFILDGNTSYMDSNGDVRTLRTDSKTIYIDMNDKYSMLNNDVIFGTLNDSKFRYTKDSETIDISRVDLTITGGTTKIKVDKDNGPSNGIQLEAIDGNNTGKYLIGFKGSDDSENQEWNNTLIAISRGGKGNKYGDVYFARENAEEDIEVNIQGNISIRDKIKTENNSIELKSSSDGWGFYLN